MTKPKNNIIVRELVNKYQANCDRITEIADACEKEQRERNEAENAEFEALTRENQILQMKMQAAAAEHLRENPNAIEEATRMIRENSAQGQRTEILLVRDMMMVADVNSGGIVPLNIQEIMRPLQEGFILDKVGLPMPTGLAGDYVWPLYENVDAELAGEGVELTDKKINLNKLRATPERVGIAIPVTNQSLNQSQGILEMIVREIMPLALRRLLNKVICSTNKLNVSTKLTGPFVALKAKATTLSVVPTFKELNGMKAKMFETGIEGSNACWVMTKNMAAILEGTPVNEKGIYVPMIQNGMLCGLPVYTSNEIRDTDGTEFIGLGDWRYQPMGLFGDIRFIVDPYSKARKDAVDFVLNADYATITVRPEAFALGKVAKA
ncbi:MAG: phage major capsid protein [Prevotella sp.]|nr:phage major capsid protein [Prevotella sp.]